MQTGCLVSSRRPAQLRPSPGVAHHAIPGPRGNVRQPRTCLCHASGDKEKSGAIEFVSSAVNSLTDLVPESVPRPVAKGGVTVIGALVVFGLLKQVLSGLFTLVVMGAVGYWWLTRQAGDEEADVGASSKKPSSSSKRGDDLDDALSDDVRRIMDKYK